MSNKLSKEEIAFQISFYESVFKKDKSNVKVIEILGHLYTITGRVADGLGMDQCLSKLKPNDATTFYNLACSYALSDLCDEAIEAIDKAIQLGYNDFKWMNKDPDLDNIREDPEFIQLLLSIKKAEDPLI
jgi:hypothetical protein